MDDLRDAPAERKGQGPSAPTVPPALARALADWHRSTAAVLAALASTATGRAEDAGDPWLDQRQSPLGTRAHCRACSSGRIEGARFVGRKWLAKASAIDAYITAHGRPATRASSPPANDVERLLLPVDDEAAIERELRAVGYTAHGRRAGGR